MNVHPPGGDNGRVSSPPPEPGSFYDAVGGHDAFSTLVARFYAGVAADPLLRPMYPGAELGPAAERLRMFLEQYWGGPTTYSDQRGHPRLRMRHAPFPVTFTARDHWLGHMRSALDSLQLRDDLRRQLWAYLTMAADSLVNTPESGDPPDPPDQTDPPETPGATMPPRPTTLPTRLPVVGP